MKFNIFARLNNLEQALGDKQKTLEAMQNSIEKLSDLVVFQGKVIGHLNRYAKFYPDPVVNESQPPETPKTETAKERANRIKREWYYRNKETIAKRRKLKAQRLKNTEAQKRVAKKYYEKNREKVILRNRQNYFKRKAAQVQA